MKTVEEIETMIEEEKVKNPTIGAIILPCSDKRDAVIIANYFRNKGLHVEVSTELNSYWGVDIRL